MLQRTESGLEAWLKVTGFGRFIGAAGLSLWLIGWGAGEAFGLSVFVGAGYSVLTGKISFAPHEPTNAIFELAVGLFILFWLTLWTLGGIAAGHELLRRLFGRDQILADDDGLQVVHSIGLVRSVKRFPRARLRRFYRTTPRRQLCVETIDGTTEMVTCLGTPAEQSELESALNGEFHLESKPASLGALPKNWREIVSLEKVPVLVKDPAIRRKQARAAWILCAAFLFLPLYLLSFGRERPDLIGGLIFSFFILGALCWAATWLSFGQNEWRLDKGRLVLQRRFGQNRRSRFEAVSLELVENNSGDNGPEYVLSAVAADPPSAEDWRAARQCRRTLCKSDDPTEPRNFGLWLSQRCQLAFTDLAKPEVKAIELEALKQQLAASGWLGRALARIVERLAPNSAAVRTKERDPQSS